MATFEKYTMKLRRNGGERVRRIYIDLHDSLVIWIKWFCHEFRIRLFVYIQVYFTFTVLPSFFRKDILICCFPTLLAKQSTNPNPLRLLQTLKLETPLGKRMSHTKKNYIFLVIICKWLLIFIFIGFAVTLTSYLLAFSFRNRFLLGETFTLLDGNGRFQCAIL